MLIMTISALLAMAQQESWVPSASTPNMKIEKANKIKKIKEEMIASERMLPKISKSLNKPSLVSTSSVEEFENVKKRFDHIKISASQAGVSSFVDIKGKIFIPSDCIIYDTHPTGVARKSDGKLNGISILMDCKKIFYQIEFTDLSQELTQTVYKELSNEFYAIKGGYVSNSFALSETGRIRRDISAIGGNRSIELVAQSKDKIDYTKSDDLSISVKIIESLLS